MLDWIKVCVDCFIVVYIVCHNATPHSTFKWHKSVSHKLKQPQLRLWNLGQFFIHLVHLFLTFKWDRPDSNREPKDLGKWDRLESNQHIFRYEQSPLPLRYGPHFSSQTLSFDSLNVCGFNIIKWYNQTLRFGPPHPFAARVTESQNVTMVNRMRKIATFI